MQIVEDEKLSAILKSLKNKALENTISFIYISDPKNVVYGYNYLAKQIFNDDIEEGLEFNIEEKATVMQIDIPNDTNSIYTEVYYKEKWFKIMKRKIHIEGEEVIIASGTEITEMKDLTLKLEFGATTDIMTNVYNRAYGFDYLKKCIYELEKYGNEFTICYLDFNNLKRINDTYGHSAGDKYIITVVNIIKKIIRSTDMFCRMGGDEFLILFPKCDKDQVEIIMEKVDKEIEVTSRLLSYDYKYAISYGIIKVEKSLETITAKEILEEADTEMYKMKRRLKAQGI
jgi:diguanylate cyclase (GGDEF)-like protein